MNWYRKSKELKEASASVSGMLANEISRWVNYTVMNLLRSNNITTQTIERDLFLSRIQDYIRVILNINVVPKLLSGLNYEASSEYNLIRLPETDNGRKEAIIINLTLANKFSKNDLNSLYLYLSESAKHEMEHKRLFKERPDTIDQVDYNIEECENADISKSFVPRVNYMLSNIEVEPYVRGLMHRARKDNKIFEELIPEIINRVLYNNIMTDRKIAINAFGLYFVEAAEQNIYNTFVEKKNQIFKQNT